MSTSKNTITYVMVREKLVKIYGKDESHLSLLFRIKKEFPMASGAVEYLRGVYLYGTQIPSAKKINEALEKIKSAILE